MYCPRCGYKLGVKYTATTKDEVLRHRHCDHCNARFYTIESVAENQLEAYDKLYECQKARRNKW